jgi:hypothetical protein
MKTVDDNTVLLSDDIKDSIDVTSLFVDGKKTRQQQKDISANIQFTCDIIIDNDKFHTCEVLEYQNTAEYVKVVCSIWTSVVLFDLLSHEIIGIRLFIDSNEIIEIMCDVQNDSDRPQLHFISSIIQQREYSIITLTFKRDS